MTKHYNTSDWINKEINGGVTPFHRWELYVLRACWANSCNLIVVSAYVLESTRLNGALDLQNFLDEIT